MKYKAHVFICTHVRDTGESCGPKGALDLLAKVKEASKSSERAYWDGKVRINKSGCLDQCSRGIASVVYPEGKWLCDLKKDDAPKLLVEIDKIVSD